MSNRGSVLKPNACKPVRIEAEYPPFVPRPLGSTGKSKGSRRIRIGGERQPTVEGYARAERSVQSRKPGDVGSGDNVTSA